MNPIALIPTPNPYIVIYFINNRAKRAMDSFPRQFQTWQRSQQWLFKLQWSPRLRSLKLTVKLWSPYGVRGRKGTI